MVSGVWVAGDGMPGLGAWGLECQGLGLSWLFPFAPVQEIPLGTQGRLPAQAGLRETVPDGI